MSGIQANFKTLFEHLDIEDFLKDPISVIGYMKDFGFTAPQINMLRYVIESDRDGLLESVRCSEESLDSVIDRICDYCLIDKGHFKAMVEGIRECITDCGPITKPHIDEGYGECRITADGKILFSEDMHKILHVDNGVESMTIPRSVTEIGGYTFRGCTSLKEVHIPDSVTKIGDCAFEGCTSLEEVHIPDSVTEIGGYAFSGCTSLKEVHIPDSVTKIGWHVFKGCTFPDSHG
ncbi:MAG: leucine-rich repeat domain-containing protein [Candidatus Methanomethylophilaceae archaeon]